MQGGFWEDVGWIPSGGVLSFDSAVDLADDCLVLQQLVDDERQNRRLLRRIQRQEGTLAQPIRHQERFRLRILERNGASSLLHWHLQVAQTIGLFKIDIKLVKDAA